MLLFLGLKPLSERAKVSAWRELAAHQTPWIQQPIEVKDSIWLSTAHCQGERGMIEYCKRTERIKSVVRYPEWLEPRYHACVRYAGDIFLVDGINGQIVAFNVSSRRFVKKLAIPKLGAHPSCVVVQRLGQIHILHGEANRRHYVYSIEANSLQTVEDEKVSMAVDMDAASAANASPKRCLESVCVVAHQNRLIRFGGMCGARRNSDKVWLSSPVTQTAMEWTQQRSMRRALSHCGYVLYGDKLVTFGGCVDKVTCTDKIFVLDLARGGGWTECAHIKCPVASCFEAVLSEDGQLHLFTKMNRVDAIKHFAAPMAQIVGSDGH